MADLQSVTVAALETLDECYAAAGLPTVGFQLQQYPVLTAQVTNLTAERDAAQTLAAQRRAAIDAMLTAAQADVQADASHAAGQGVLDAGASAP